MILQRVGRARRLLESTDATVEQIAHHAGFGTSTNLRQHFRRTVGTTPTAYRAAFEQRRAG